MVRRWIRVAFDIGYAAYRSWSDHRAIRIGAGVAYYWLFAIVPLTLLAVSIAAAFFSIGDITEWVLKLLGEVSATNQELAELMETLMARTDSTTMNLVAGILAAISASFAVAATQDALNMVWDEPKRRGFGANVRRRAILFAAAVAMSSLLVVALMAAAMIGAIESVLPGRFLDQTLEVISTLGVYATGFGLVTFAFRYMPNRVAPWWPSIIAAVITVLSLAVATWGYGVYLDRTQQVSLAGAAGSVLATLVWMYVLAQIFVAGGELTRAIHEHGTPPPADGAAPAGVADGTIV